MTTINAGSTLVHQYAPPFVISDLVTTNWQLRYNANLLAFEAFDPDESVIETGFDSIESALFTDVTQQVFVVPWEAATKESLFITIQGVKQQQDAYTSITNTGSGSTTITLGDTVSVETVEILGLQTSGGASIEIYLETAAAAQTTFPAAGSIGWYPASEQSLIVTLDGIKQTTTEYSVLPNATFTGAQVVLVAAPGDGVVVEVLGIATAGETPASPVELVNLIPADEALFSAKRVAGETQFFDIKGLTEGTNVTLTSDANAITINADVGDFANIGSGVPVALIGTLSETITPTNELEFRRLFTATTPLDRITLSSTVDTITFAYNLGYKTITDVDSPYTALTAERLIIVNGLAAPTAITLLAPSAIPTGDTITVKNQTTGTSDITLTPATGQVENQAVRGTLTASYVINTAGGYVTLYSDGTNYHIIAEG